MHTRDQTAGPIQEMKTASKNPIKKLTQQEQQKHKDFKSKQKQDQNKIQWVQHSELQQNQ